MERGLWSRAMVDKPPAKRKVGKAAAAAAATKPAAGRKRKKA